MTPTAASETTSDPGHRGRSANGELDRLLDGDAMVDLLADHGVTVESVRPDYLRHKPGESTIVGYQVVCDDGTDSRFHLRHCTEQGRADRRRADQLEAKARTLRPTHSPLGPSVLRLDAGTVAYAFPLDPSLPRLRWWVEPRKLKRSLAHLGRPAGRVTGRTTVEILRYKPQRRLVARVDLHTADGADTPLLVRYSSRPAGRLHRVAEALRAAGVGCPAPITRGEGDRVTVDRFVSGSTLGHRLADEQGAGRVDPGALAEALVRFHTTPIPVGLDRRRPDHEWARANDALAGLVALRPDLQPLADHLAGALAATMPADPGDHQARLIHGDLHTGNVLVGAVDEAAGEAAPGRPGNALWFVDLDRAGPGQPVVDLAALLAQGMALPLRRPGWCPGALDHATQVVEAYRHHRVGPGITDRSLAWHTSVALIDQALLPLRQATHPHNRATELIVKTAIDLLHCLDPSGALL